MYQTLLKNPLQKISHQILLSYTIPLLCLLGMCFGAYRSARNTFLVEAKRDELYESMYAADNASYYLMKSIQSTKASLIEPENSQYLRDYRSSRESFLESANNLSARAEQTQDADMADLVRTFIEIGDQINSVAQRSFLLIDDEDSEEAAYLIRSFDANGLSETRESITNHINEQIDQNTENLLQAQARFRNTLIGGTVLATIATLGIGWILVQKIRSQIKKMVGVVEQNGIQVATSSTQISASSRQLEASVSEQVASTHQITATTAEIAATAEELNRTIERVAELSESASQMATSGKKDIETMAQMIHQLTASTAAISSKLGQIDDKANNISAVVTTINKVADQTNLLSLNAAIEAEKAGEYGAGFSIVAREIRRLADQTAVATLDIEKMVEEMTSSVSTGVMEMDKFAQDVDRGADSITDLGNQMVQIIYQVESLAPQFEAVSSGMNAQAQGAQQIKAAMEQLNDTSQQTADSVKDTNQAIVQLSDVARDLQTEVSQFRLAV